MSIKKPKQKFSRNTLKRPEKETQRDSDWCIFFKKKVTILVFERLFSVVIRDNFLRNILKRDEKRENVSWCRNFDSRK